MDKVEHQKASEEKAEQIVQELSNWVNAMGHSNQTFVQALMLEHRTIQQQVFELMLCCVDAWAKSAHYDLRSEFTVMTSKEIMTVLHGSTRVPYI